MHVIKGMVGCLGDMEKVMINLHEEPNICKSVFLIVILKEEEESRDTGKERLETFQSQSHPDGDAFI